MQASALSDTLSFDRISIALAEGEERKRVGEEFISRQGILAHALRFDCLYGMEWLGEMAPARWSDFDGWKQNLEGHNSEMQSVRTAERTVIEETGLGYQRRGGY